MEEEAFRADEWIWFQCPTRQPTRLHKLPFLCRNLIEPIYDEHYFEVKSIAEVGRKMAYKTEIISNGKCPFCGWTAGSARHIKKHCLRFHSDQFQCRILEMEKGSIRMQANRWHRRDMGVELVGVYFIRRRASRLRKRQCCRKLNVTRATLHQHMRSVKSNNMIPEPPGVQLGAPKRQYYHSRSRLPVAPDHVLPDSDDESNAWLDEFGEAGISTFTDVDETEKKFINLWNRFCRQVVVIADMDTYSTFLEFIRQYVEKLKGLRVQLLKHTMTFWEHKRISRDQMLACMMEYDRTQKQNSACK